MKSQQREPPKDKFYHHTRIQDGGIMDTFTKSSRKRMADKKKRKESRRSRKQNRKS